MVIILGPSYIPIDREPLAKRPGLSATSWSSLIAGAVKDMISYTLELGQRDGAMD